MQLDEHIWVFLLSLKELLINHSPFHLLLKIYQAGHNGKIIKLDEHEAPLQEAKYCCENSGIMNAVLFQKPPRTRFAFKTY